MRLSFVKSSLELMSSVCLLSLLSPLAAPLQDSGSVQRRNPIRLDGQIAKQTPRCSQQFHSHQPSSLWGGRGFRVVAPGGQRNSLRRWIYPFPHRLLSCIIPCLHISYLYLSLLSAFLASVLTYRRIFLQLQEQTEKKLFNPSGKKKVVILCKMYIKPECNGLQIA